MAIKVRFFASLRERIGGHGERGIDFTGPLTVADVWQRAAGDHPLPANTLAAVNMEYTGFDSPVRDGDEVAFFPPVTGG